MSRLPRFPRPRLSYANICSTAALAVALGTGTAYAADTIGSEDIIDGQVKNADLAVNAVNTGKIFNGGVWGQDVKLGDLTGEHLADGSIFGADLGTSSVGSEEIIFDAVGSSEIRTDAVGSTEVADNAIEGDEVLDRSLTGADVLNDGLTMSDIAGGGISSGLVSFSSISNGRCVEVDIAILGAANAGDGVVLTTRRDMPNGVFLYATEVSADDNVRAVLCNMSGAASPAITDLPVRIHTFR